MTRPAALLMRIAVEHISCIVSGDQITQSLTAFLTVERQLRGRPIADRVELVHLLKTRTFRSLRRAAPLLGYSARQLQRSLAIYITRGLDALLQRPVRLGRQAQVRDEAWTALI